MNSIVVNYGGENQSWNTPVRNLRKNTIRVPKKNYQSSNVQQHRNHYLPEKQHAQILAPASAPALAPPLGKHANAFTQKAKLGNYSPAELKSAHAPRHPLLMRNTGTRNMSHATRSIRTNAIRKLFRKKTRRG